MRVKIAPNLIKIGVHAYLSNGYLNTLSKLNFDKFNKSAFFNLGFTNVEGGPKYLKIVDVYVTSECILLCIFYVL